MEKITYSLTYKEDGRIKWLSKIEKEGGIGTYEYMDSLTFNDENTAKAFKEYMANVFNQYYWEVTKNELFYHHENGEIDIDISMMSGCNSKGLDECEAKCAKYNGCSTVTVANNILGTIE